MNDFNIKMSRTADDDFFGSLKENKFSKLEQLFCDDALSTDDKDKSLKYERPKDIAATSNTISTTLVAKVVTAYRQGELQGKVGLALVQNVDICSIIMYKAKAHVLTILKLNPGKDLLYKHKNYWQFYDDTSTYWSFSFDKPGDEKYFVEKLTAKNIKFIENQESECSSGSHLNYSSLDNVAHSIASEDCRNKSPIKERRNSLIQRMAKMGKPLPILASNHHTNTEFSDSSDNEVIQTPLTSSLKAPRSKQLMTGKSNQHFVSSIVDLNSVASSVFPFNPLESQCVQMLLTEQRTQGSEIRMNMNKLENKIEKVLDKLELHGRNDDKRKVEKDDEILELEEKLLWLKKENRNLKQKIQQNHSHHSKENELEDIIFAFKEDLKIFNIDYNQDYKNILVELCDKLKEHTSTIEEMEKEMNENESKLKKVAWELELSVKKNCELKNEISLLNQKENELKNLLNEKEAESFKQKHDILDLQGRLLEKKQVTMENTNDAFIKSVMNNLFLDIAHKLDNGSFAHSEQVISLVATSIKQQTLASLQKSIQKDNINLNIT